MAMQRRTLVVDAGVTLPATRSPLRLAACRLSGRRLRHAESTPQPTWARILPTAAKEAVTAAVNCGSSYAFGAGGVRSATIGLQMSEANQWQQRSQSKQ